MSYEMLVGLQIKDDDLYTKYREAMTPLLKIYGGGFRYDFKVSSVLKNEEGRPINRVFTIYFGNKEQVDEFFSDKDYKAIKLKYFESSVEATTILSEYDRK
jgi:uncharacterized protein (DUF1330 family)